MITTKHGIKISLKPNNKKLKITPSIKKYFEECEKKIAEELDKLYIGYHANWKCWMDEDGEFKTFPIADKDLYK